MVRSIAVAFAAVLVAGCSAGPRAMYGAGPSYGEHRQSAAEEPDCDGKVVEHDGKPFCRHVDRSPGAQVHVDNREEVCGNTQGGWGKMDLGGGRTAWFNCSRH